MYKTVLVPLDGSSLAENALHYATPLAEAEEGRMVLVRAINTTDLAIDIVGQITYPDPSVEEVQSSAEKYLDFVSLTHGYPRTDIITYTGRPATMILECEQKTRANLIVMSTHGRSGVSRWMLGSVTEKVLQQAQVPMLIVRDRRPLKRILVPLDGSTRAEIIMRHAIHLATVFDAELTLLRVLAKKRDSLTSRIVTLLPDAINATAPAIEPDQDTKYLLDAAKRLVPTHIPVKVQEQVGDPAEMILQVSRGHDLIAMSTHGYSGLERYLYGSVMEKVLRAADRPMLIVRPWL